MARANAAAHGRAAHRVPAGRPVEDSEDRLDYVVANLPTSPPRRSPSVMPDVREYEPRAALDGAPTACHTFAGSSAQPGADGSGGTLFLEIGHGQGRAALESVEQPRVPASPGGARPRGVGALRYREVEGGHGLPVDRRRPGRTPVTHFSLSPASSTPSAGSGSGVRCHRTSRMYSSALPFARQLGCPTR